MPVKSSHGICLVCSGGGHLEEMRQLEPVYSSFPYFYILPRTTLFKNQIENNSKVYCVVNVNEGRGIRNPFLLLACVTQCMAIFLRERPFVILSTGAGVAFPAFIAGILLGSRRVFVESFTRINRPSISGRACYRLSNLFLVQHARLRRSLPKAHYFGSLFEHL